MAKANLERSTEPTSDERDQTQRSFGFLGFSAIAHAGLLIAICLAPIFKTQTIDAQGADAGATLELNNSADAASAPVTASETQTPPTTSATTEVMLADANDASAVQLPSSETAAVTPPPPPASESAPLPPVKTKASKIEKTPAPKPADSIAEALKAARSQPVEAKPAKVTEVKTDAKPEAKPEASTMTDAASDIAVATEPEPEQLVASNESQLKDQEPTAEADEAEPKDEAVPLEIAIPEKEAMRDEDAALLQASPKEKAQMLAANEAATSQNEIPSNATPITTIPTARSTNGAQGPAAPRVLTTAPAGAQVLGRGANGNSVAAQPGSSRGEGTALSVPLGVPVRDARSLIAAQGNQKPTYPIADQMAGRQGTAVLVAKVKNDGTIENVTLEKSSGSKLMDESAAKAFKTWRYQPGQEGYVRLPVEFKLAGEAKAVPAQLRRQ